MKFLDAARRTSTSWDSWRRPLFRTTQMRRDHRVPSESANRRLSSTSRDAGTTEKDCTASADGTTLGLTRSVASQKESQSGMSTYRATRHAAAAARVRRCVRICSITVVCVMNATLRLVPWHVGHASGSIATICCRIAAHRCVASVGASRGGGGRRPAPHPARPIGVPPVGPHGVSYRPANSAVSRGGTFH